MKKSLCWAEILLPALSLTFGLQITRTIWPYLRDLLDDRLGWDPVLAALVPFVVFAAAFLTGWLNRWLGLRRLLFVSAAGLGLARLAMQLWAGDPIGDMILALSGTACFSLFLPAYLAMVQSQPERMAAVTRFTSAILLGLALDVSLHGAFLTYDFIWQNGLASVLLAASLVAVQWVSLMALLPLTPAVSNKETLGLQPSWLAFGPFLALEVLVFQNPARLATLTGWSLPLAFAWVLTSHILALWLAPVWPWRKLTGVSILGAVLILLLLPTGQVPIWFEAIIILVGQIALAIRFNLLGLTLATEAGHTKVLNPALIHGLSWLMMVIFMFLSYILYLNLPLPFEHGLPLSITALVVFWGAIKAATAVPQSAEGPKSWLAAKLALPLLGFPLFVFFTWHTPAAHVSAAPDSIRVMTYNVHNGFNTQGHLDLVALSQVISAAQPDIVALQEVSQGSIVNGGVDMLSWFSQQLNLPYIFTPAGDGLWGQATLSRYPIKLAENYPLPPAATRRTFGYLQIDVGQAEPLQVINTHYQPRYGTNQLQLIHTETIINFLAQHPSERFVIMGDLNAEPDTPQMQPFFEHGFIDVIEHAGLVPGNTARSDNPVSRIDYILISSDLTAVDVTIPPSTASDHLSVVATLQWQ